MGEAGRSVKERQRKVTLTEDYWMGIFEVTQTQWELLLGNNTSGLPGDVRPVESVDCDRIRWSNKGRRQPHGRLPDNDSFLGILRAKTGLDFDLPSEAQWEYACRAGTMTALNSGMNLTGSSNCQNLAVIGRYEHNQNDGKGGYSEHTKVGSYQPNAWGLYDMHGNVEEWCLDWTQTSGQTQPSRSTVLRGGCWRDRAERCCSSSCNHCNFASNTRGFRVVCFPY